MKEKVKQALLSALAQKKQFDEVIVIGLIYKSNDPDRPQTQIFVSGSADSGSNEDKELNLHMLDTASHLVHNFRPLKKMK